MNEKQHALQWEAGIPLVTNPFIWADLAKGLGISWIVFIALATGILWDESWAERWPAWGVVTLCHLFVAALFATVCLFIFRNRFAARFTLTSKGALYESGRLAAKAATAGLAAGLLARNPGLAGASLLASTQNSLMLPWREVKKCTRFPRRQVITLSNGWRPVLRLYCPDQAIYQQALDYVNARTGETAGNVDKHKQIREKLQ